MDYGVGPVYTFVTMNNLNDIFIFKASCCIALDQ